MEAAGKAYRRAEAALNARREELAEAIVAAAKVPGLKLSVITRASTYQYQHVQRIRDAAKGQDGA